MIDISIHYQISPFKFSNCMVHLARRLHLRQHPKRKELYRMKCAHGKPNLYATLHVQPQAQTVT